MSGNRLKRLMLAWCQGLGELLLYYPFVVVLYALVPHMAPVFSIWLAIVSVFYLAGFAFHDTFPATRKWLSLLTAIALPGLIAWYASWPAIPIFLLNGALWILSWIRGSQNRLWGWSSSFPSGLLWIGMLGYFIASLLVPRFETTAPYSVSVTVLGIVALGAALYRTNSLSLSGQSSGSPQDGKRRVSAETRWRNRTLVLSVFAAIVLIASIGAIASAVKRAALYVFFGVIGLIRKLLSLFASDEGGQPPPAEPPPDMSGLLPPGQPSALALLLEKVLYVVVALLLAAGACWLLYIASKYVRRWLRRLLGWYGERLDNSNEAGYVDEKQSLLDGREWVRAKSKQWTSRLADTFRRLPGWEELPDNRERVRYAYRLLLLRRIAAGYKHDESRTPRETRQELTRRAPLGSDESEVIPLYEEVRYGGKDITDEQAAALRSMLRPDGKNRM
ncbi:DUF4129 domain-containing protein [Paenibacillus hodogayensis]|uniref:DUF4129 domain-containing protein n=1 Tax=Paenibacillus hodogayensis TaxID=279208 RepID=A0ABV5VSI7_9BACL